MRTHPPFASIGWSIILFLAGATLAPAAAPKVSFTNDTLTIQTARYQVTWQNGCLVGLKTFLPKAVNLSLAAGPMNLESLPNGLGSSFGHQADVSPQHGMWGFERLPKTYPAQHPATKDSQVEFSRLPTGARLTYTGLKDDPQAVLIQELTVDPATGDLLIRQSGKSPNPGVFGIGFSLLNLRPDITLDVPYFGGQHWTSEFAKDMIVSLSWSRFWNAGFAIGELPKGGSFIVWADDPGMHAKYFRRYNAQGALGLGFEACSDAPYTQTELTAFTWRFNTFPGSWRDAAQRYKDWLVQAYQVVPRKQRPAKWIDDIALIWPANPEAGAMKEMAKIMDPHKVLIHNWGWLKDFNRRIPEYIPQDPHYAAQVARAHELGYHVGGYTSMLLFDQEAFPTLMKDYDLEYYYYGFSDPKPAPGAVKDWLVYVHPGSTKWREFYSNKMQEINARYGVDFLYQDVAGGSCDSAGLVEGKTLSAGVRAVEQAIRAKVPQAAIGGEYWTEGNAASEDFGICSYLAWGDDPHKAMISDPKNVHPVMSYVFSEFCPLWQHGIMTRDTKRFHQDETMAEVLGAVPVWNTGVADQVSEAHLVLERAKLWADGFRPYFPKKWDPAAIAYLRNPKGRVVKYVTKGGGILCLEEQWHGSGFRFGRVKGATAFPASYPVNIDGWIAYDARGPIGLNPEDWYCLFAGAPKELPITITRLPAGAYLKGLRATENYCLVELGGTGSGRVSWRTGQPLVSITGSQGPFPVNATEVTTSLPASILFTYKEAEPAPLATVLPLEKWPAYIVNHGQVISGAAILNHYNHTLSNVTHAAWIVAPPLGGKESEMSLDKLMKLPNDPQVALQVTTGRVGGAGTGVNMVVRVNGREIWRQFRDMNPGWKDATIPLGSYAGQAVVLSLAIDCGPVPHSTSCSESLWADPKIVIAR